MQQCCPFMETTIPTHSPPQLRPYQAAVVKGIYEKIREGYRRILCFAPTGVSKTVLSSQIVAHTAQRKTGRCIEISSKQRSRF
jgi:superfamily II DNA or RNA helicase